jgi:uncharacterized protein YutD
MIDGKMKPFISVSHETAVKKAQNEADRIHKAVWVYCSTGDGYFLLEVCTPPHRYIKSPKHLPKAKPYIRQLPKKR